MDVKRLELFERLARANEVRLYGHVRRNGNEEKIIFIKKNAIIRESEVAIFVTMRGT